MERPLLSEIGFGQSRALTLALGWPEWRHTKLTWQRNCLTWTMACAVNVSRGVDVSHTHIVTRNIGPSWRQNGAVNSTSHSGLETQGAFRGLCNTDKEHNLGQMELPRMALLGQSFQKVRLLESE